MGGQVWYNEYMLVMEPNFKETAMKVGDKVVLKSEDGSMTVESIEGDIATCLWIDSDGQDNHDSFPLSSLQSVE